MRDFLFVGYSIRLIGGDAGGEGNVYVNGKPVCDDDWNINAGKVACRELGYGGVVKIRSGEYYTDFNKSNFFKPQKTCYH